jgi:hypothetical protein
VHDPLYHGCPGCPAAGFCVGAIVAFLLNLVMPADAEPPTESQAATEVSCRNGKQATDVEDQRVSLRQADDLYVLCTSNAVRDKCIHGQALGQQQQSCRSHQLPQQPLPTATYHYLTCAHVLGICARLSKACDVTTMVTWYYSCGYITAGQYVVTLRGGGRDMGREGWW